MQRLGQQGHLVSCFASPTVGLLATSPNERILIPYSPQQWQQGAMGAASSHQWPVPASPHEEMLSLTPYWPQGAVPAFPNEGVPCNGMWFI